MVASLLANLLSDRSKHKKAYEPADFMPFLAEAKRRRKRPQSPEEMLQAAKQINESLKRNTETGN